MRELAKIDEDVARHLIDKIVLLTPNAKSVQHFPRVLGTSQTDDFETGEASPIPRTGRGKQARKTGGPNVSNKRMEVEVFAQQELDFISEAIHLAIDGGKGAWDNAGGYEFLFPKAEEEESHQIDPKADVGSDCEFTTTAGDKPQEVNRKQRRLMKKVTTIIKSQQAYNKTCKNFSPRKDVNHDAYEGLDPQIFVRLGVKVVHPPTNSTARKELVAKLIGQIKEDLAIQAQEQTEAKLREEGFWRWAGKSAYHSIMANRENVDWQTGMKRYASKESSTDKTMPQTPVEDKDTEEGQFANLVIDDETVRDDVPLGDASLDKSHDDVAVQEPVANSKDAGIERTEKAATERPRRGPKAGRVRPKTLILRIL